MISWLAIGGLGMGAAQVVLANAYVLASAGDSTSSLSEVPRTEIAIVPGARVEPDGKMSAMLAARVKRAARLWHAGKVEKILASGDHGTWKYDEPDTMREGGIDATGLTADLQAWGPQGRPAH